MNRALPLALVLLTGCEATLPPAPAHARVAPAPRPPPMQVCWLEYAINEVPGGFSLAGPSERKRWVVTMSGLLVRHPKGHLLIDVGNSSHFAEEIADSSFINRQYLMAGPGSGHVVRTAPEALKAVGEDPSQLKAVVVSHLHGDHAGGLVDLPGVPVLLPQEELDFAAKLRESKTFAVVRAHAAALDGRATPLAFAEEPYENFDRSADYFGDGSVVFVRLFGHTPGSVGTFVNRSPGERLLHLGDAINSTEALSKRVGKSFALSWTDNDPDRAEALVAKLSQLHEQDPALSMLPAHDRQAWEALFPGGPGTCVGTAP